MKPSLFKTIRKRGKFIACFFALNLLVEVVAPLQAYALTGGPSQPEVTSFEPVGTTEMVDLFSGDFSYNIPLFDIGGYPVNISYHGGISMDQEASWVGLGWNINPGAINRGMRGVPDDFIGDEVKKTMNIKKNETWATNFNSDGEIFGFTSSKIKLGGKTFNTKNSYNQGKRMNKLSKFNFGFGIVYNTYKGIGYSLDLKFDINKTSYFSREEFNENMDLLDNFKKIKDDPDLDLINREGSKDYYQALDANYKSTTAQKVVKKQSSLNANINLSASSNEGAKINLTMSNNFQDLMDDRTNLYRTITPSIGLGYNSLLGVNSFDVGLSKRYSWQVEVEKGAYYSGSINRSVNSYIPIGSYSYTPNIHFPTLSTSQSYNATVGFDAFGGHPNMRLSGFYNSEELKDSNIIYNAFGYLQEQEVFWHRGKNYVLMDFNREKESKGNKSSTHLPLSNHTYDIFMVTGQGNGGIYRPHRKTIGLLCDPYTENSNKKTGMNDFGIELGFGANFHWGFNYKNKVQNSSTGLWYNNNQRNFSIKFNEDADFFNSSLSVDFSKKNNVLLKDKDNELVELLNYRMEDGTLNKRNNHFYFKSAGEQTPSDNDLGDNWGGKFPVSLRIGKTEGHERNFRFGKVTNKLNESTHEVKGHSTWNTPRNSAIEYLSAEEASHGGIGMEPFIVSYPQNYWTYYIKSQNLPTVEVEERYNGANGAKAHHISEIITYGGDGMRYVYGLPAYNKKQHEVNFAVSKDIVGGDLSTRYEDWARGLVKYEPGQDNSTRNTRGADNFFMSTEMPPYAHSYLLTGVLSPDYSDLTGDGITDDDYGSAVRFNYYKVPGSYKWRTPYEKDSANLDLGYITDFSDNKGSYVYGEKEIWYVQSMESKTHVAEFKLSRRFDGHGVASENGGLDTSESNTLMKLDSIVIYSKLDILANGRNAVPVKTIVFKYDYSLCAGIPNNSVGQGKLTLKSIYFTYGNSGKGVLNPYQFEYSNFNPAYSHVHFDKWGNYKYANENLPNRDFPYSDMDSNREVYDKYASAWNLTKVKLPSGGEINVTYEADDYAYVQDRRAMQMIKVIGASSDYKNFKLYNALKIKPDIYKKNKPIVATLYDEGRNNNFLYFKLLEEPAEIPTSGQSDYIVNKYLKDENGQKMSFVYYRFKVNMDPRAKNEDHFEYISGYAEIELNKCGITDDKKYGFIKLKEVDQGDVGLTKAQPIAKQAWQEGMQNLRKVMYPGSDQSQPDVNGDKQSAFKALLNSYGQALNMFTGPYQNLRWKHIAKNFEVGKSFIRLYRPDNFKVGGGSRVKRITINDNWSAMNTNQESNEYGQEYFYLTKNQNGEVISSGVASYEPFVGGDENPFRIPTFYSTNRFMFPDLNEYLEEPFGESFFPSASVGYSKIIVKNIPKPGVVASSTGKIVHEFYTYKDFPIVTRNTNLKYLTNGNGNSSDEKNVNNKKAKKFSKALASLFSVVKRDYMAATQGYSIILNDMHGKPKSMKVYSALDEAGDDIEKLFSGRMLSGTEYKYKTSLSENRHKFDDLYTSKDTLLPFIPGTELNNTVWVMKENGELVEREIATSYDVSVETKQSKSHYRHAGVDFNTENFLLAGIPCPYPKYLVNQSLFQAAIVTKVIQQYGVLEEVIAYDHSSVVRTKNLVWDEQTGQVLLTSTTNEFNDPIYNFTYPAHLAYEGMGPAYKNLDYETYLTIGSDGDVNVNILSEEDQDMFVEGDELLLRKDEVVIRAWVLKVVKNSSTGNYHQIRLINQAGHEIGSGTWYSRVIRSGRRNLSGAPVGAITTMFKGIFNNDSSKRLKLNKEVVQSAAMTYSDQWQGYVDKASFLRYVCDTSQIGNEEAYALIKSIVETGNIGAYYQNGSNLSPDASTLSAYTGGLKNSVESYARSLDVTQCGTNKELIGTYFGQRIETPGVFNFKAKFRCVGSGDTVIRDLTCEIFLEKVDSDCEIELDSLDEVGSYYLDAGYLYFNGYKGEDSCLFKLTFPNICFLKVDCRYVQDCDYYVGKIVNPYVNNIRGVWRQKESFAYNSGRNYEVKSNNNTNIRKDGLINDYHPFWLFKDTSENGIYQSNHNKWVSSSTATLFAPEGNGLEEMDALGIYSSQLFGYNDLLSVAQASNARHSQIASDNFEDYFSAYVGCQREKHFDFRNGLNLGQITLPTYAYDLLKVVNVLPIPSSTFAHAHIARDTAHTGLFSLCVNSGATHSNIRKLDYSDLALASGNDSLFRLKSVEDMITTFAPTNGRYVLSSWVYQTAEDQNSLNTYSDAYVNVKVFKDGTAIVDKNYLASGKIIDKWQRIYGVLDIPTESDSIRVTFVNNGESNAYFDDIRIHPFDSKMICNVYHFTNLKVIAILDENNFATFYEYDNEGSLIRVKRETENGILTIQESRKSIRKTPN